MLSGTRPRRIWSAAPSPVGRSAFAAVLGLAVGCLTSFGQAHLDGALNALVNSASAWLVAPFLVGALMMTRRGAAAAGLSTCALQLVGYSVTAHLRGFPAGGSIVLFWTACAVLGGPLFGLAGHLWRTETAWLRDLGASALPAAFFAEGLWVYLHELHYYDTAALWIAIGAVLAIGLPGARGLALTLPLAVAGEIALTAIYSQSF